MAVTHGPSSTVTLHILDTIAYDGALKVDNFRKEWVGPDNNVYVISRGEQVTLPGWIGEAWAAADSDLEIVARS